MTSCALLRGLSTWLAQPAYETRAQDMPRATAFELLFPEAYYPFSFSLQSPESPERFPFSKIYVAPRALVRGPLPDQA